MNDRQLDVPLDDADLEQVPGPDAPMYMTMPTWKVKASTANAQPWKAAPSATPCLAALSNTIGGSARQKLPC